ncbi:hypothetical protein ASPTUDRAFT_129754 [Aspergillus tubingensis CBS 134.48]|uniref:(S)-ureidoglycine aminohydrolase cupin domain-containing protein n=1 Tax=Aspergillus tubingensis (strain CBS 134.48) TaxID=767770 RepID=A0A1L9MTD1_ASPTC|nr:hypothetical protein ASPTUDRAFT_129754 [Aspergillus tubingensis CBS 134.48]
MAIAFKHHPRSQQTYEPPLIANENAFLGDVDSSDSYNPEKPISAGFYRLEKGTPLVYEYTFDEMKIILEGKFEISDETGQKVEAFPGDVFHFPKGSKVTFTTPSYGLAFFVSIPFQSSFFILFRFCFCILLLFNALFFAWLLTE